MKKPSAAGRLLSICALLGGCAGNPNDLGEVSAELERRTGHGLAETKPGETAWPPGVSFRDGLSEDELVTLALWNNAAFREVLADLGLSRADLVQAGMLPNPSFWMLVPMGAKPLELLLRYPLEVLWLRPGRVASAQLDVQRTAERLVQNGLDLIRDVRLASAELALAGERLEIAGTMAKLGRDIAELTQARLRAGDATELEAENARVDALQAEEQLARWKHDADIARERLRSLAGLGLERWPQRIEADPLPSAIENPVERRVNEALAARPDFRAAELGLEAAGRRIGLARAEAFTFTAILSTKDVAGHTLSGPGLDVALPVFNQNQGGIAQAQARFEKAARQHATLRDRIVLEVREAAARLTQARESHDQWRQRILPPLEASVRDAERAYAAGNVAYLFTLETRRRLFDARLRAATAAADLRRARAELERSVGQRLGAPTDTFNKASAHDSP